MSKNFQTVEKVMGQTARSVPTAHDITLSNGIVLDVHKVPTSLLMDVISELRKGKPKPPLVYDKRLDRDEPNEADPDFINDTNNFMIDQAKKLNDTLLMLGTSFISVPKGMYAPDNDDWSDGLETIMDIGQKGKRKRYMAWLKAYALNNDDDIALLTKEVGRLSGVLEADVAAATETFRSEEGQPADPGDG